MIGAVVLLPLAGRIGFERIGIPSDFKTARKANSSWVNFK